MKKHLVPLLILALFFCALPPARALGLGADQPEKKLTLMVYMCGSNLESRFGSASADIQEMLDSGFDSDQINLLVMTGGSEKWAMGFGTGRTMIHEISRRGRRAVWPGRGEAEETLNMGAQSTLSFFLLYGAEHYPAEKYALILWDHGGGPMAGVCWDELFQMDNLSIRNVAEALNDFQWLSHGKRISWIGFDACLMSSLEVASTLAPYADYMIASQETEPALGWNYAFLKGLEADENGGETGRRIVDSYFEQGSAGGDTLTLSCVDLRKIGIVSSRMDPFFRRQAQQVTGDLFPRLSSLRMQSRGFGKADITAASDYDLVDLSDLVARLDAEGGEELLQAVRDAVVYARASVPGACGLSVYHPYRNKQRYRDAWRNDYVRMEGSQGYAEYIFRFGAMLLSDEMISWGGLRTRYDGREAGAYHLSCPLTTGQASEFVSGRLLILTGSSFNDGVVDTYNPIASCPARLDENGVLQAEYDGRALYALVTEGTEEKRWIGPLGVYETGEPDVGAVSVVLVAKDDARGLENGMIFFRDDPDRPDRVLARMAVHDPVTGTFSNRMLFRPEDYVSQYFRFRQAARPRNDDGGTLPGFSEWLEDSGRGHWESVRMDESWELRYADLLSSGRLFAVFEIRDARQNVYCSYLTEIPNPNLTELSVRPLQETGTNAGTLAAWINHSVMGQGLKLKLTAQEPAGEFHVNEVVVNGARSAEPEWGTQYYLDENGHYAAYLSIPAEQLLLIDSLRTVDLEVVFDPYGGKIKYRYSFELTPADLRGVVPACDVLAEAENGEAYFRLLFCGALDNGDIRLVFSMKKLKHEDPDIGGNNKDGYLIAVNGYQTNDYAAFVERSDYEKIVIADIGNTVSDGFSLKVGGVHGFERDMALSENTLQRRGVRQVDTVTVCKRAYDTGRAEPLVLRLPEPVILPAGSPRNEARYWYGALENADPDAAEEVTLIDWPDYAIRLERVLAGDNGMAFLMALENRTDLQLKISLKDTRFNDQPLDSYEDVRIMPHSTLIHAFMFRTDVSSLIKKERADLRDVADFSFTVQGPPQAENPLVRVHFSRPVSVGAYGGTVLEAGQMTAEPPAPPARPEEMPLEPGVLYQAAEYRDEYTDFRWESCRKVLRVIVYENGTAVITEGGLSTDFTWGFQENGAMVLKATIFKPYTITRVRGRVILRTPGAEYTLEPVQQP